MTALADTAPIDRSRWYGAREDVVVLTVTSDVFAEGLKVIGSGSDITVPLKGENGQPVTLEVVSRNGVPIRIYGRFQHDEIELAGGLPVAARIPGRSDAWIPGPLPTRHGPRPDGDDGRICDREFPVPCTVRTFDWITRYWTPAPPPLPVSSRDRVLAR